MFGFKGQQKRRDVARTVDRFLDVEYHFWLNRRPPHGLIDKLVNTTLDPNPIRLAGGSTLVLNPIVDAATALQYGYTAFQLSPVDQTMCANALMELFLYAAKNEPEARLTDNDQFVLRDMGRTTTEDPAFEAARDYQTPEMSANLEKMLAKGRTK